MTTRERLLVSFIEFLLDYARRVAQHQVVQNDLTELLIIRNTIKQIKTSNSTETELKND